MPRCSNRHFIQQLPFPCNDPPLFVIPRATEGSAVRHSCARSLPAHNLHQSSPNTHGSTNLPFVFPRFQERSAELQIPPLPSGMTKRGGSLQGKGVAEPRHLSNLIWTGLKFSRPYATKCGNGVLLGSCRLFVRQRFNRIFARGL